MRILLIAHRKLLPPQRAVGRAVRRNAPWRTEHDVWWTLTRLGHDVEVLGLDADLEPLRHAVETSRPHLVFNLLEQLGGEVIYDWMATAMLELWGQRYTGCNPRGMILSRDKALCKKILAAHGVPVPDFVVFPRGGCARWPVSLAGPLIVKPLVEQASLGVSQAAVVRRPAALQARVAMLHRRFDVDAIAESYVPGRELYVSLLGNRRPRALPPWELCFAHLPRRALPIASERVKWNRAAQRRYRVRSQRARLRAATERQLLEHARRSYQALGLSGCARLDFRGTEETGFLLVDVNPNPQIALGEEFAQAAAAAGLSYEALLSRLVRLGRQAPAEPRFFGWAGAISRVRE